MRAPLAAAIAIAVGLIVLAGYFFPLQLLKDVQAQLIGWGVILAGVAALVGIINLIGAHWRKVSTPADRDVYSPVLILAFLATFVAGLVLTPADAGYQKVVTFIQAPVEMSMLALLAISLAYACLRMLQRRKTTLSLVFLISALVFLVFGSGYLSALYQIPGLSDLYGLLSRLPLAGSRGILIGIGLGSLTAGLRILMGFDRPHSG